VKKKELALSLIGIHGTIQFPRLNHYLLHWSSIVTTGDETERKCERTKGYTCSSLSSACITLFMHSYPQSHFQPQITLSSKERPLYSSFFSVFSPTTFKPQFTWTEFLGSSIRKTSQFFCPEKTLPFEYRGSIRK
jgi:hypothetical protein